MELQEQAEACTDAAEVQRLLQVNAQRQQSVVQQLGDAISGSAWQQARSLLQQLRYWSRLDETLRDKAHLLA